MPIIDIELVEDDPKIEPDTHGVRDSSVAQKLADELGTLLNSEAGGTWIRLRSLPRSCYAENNTTLPDQVRPVFVHILHSQLPETAVLALEAEQICHVVSRILGRPQENVHILYLPEGQHRIAFGGKLLRA